ncbi:hypothetical protein [uncultured Chryseobacterium sp.]|uniref:terminase small subunit-like protein n=1 Tax=uncultured Chryseobacterium sp. TaxID=259322 RepID=UPI00258BBB4B|nr:hypothetical protein [uncultured Chryseobacterium sp.]
MARPSEYDFELCKKICDEVANGENIISVLKESTYPSWSTFRRWKNENDELRTLYVNSQQDKGIALENEIDDVMQSLKAGEMEASVGNVLIQTLKWKMAKFYPKMFGDKLDVETNGNLNITWNEEKTYE